MAKQKTYILQLAASVFLLHFQQSSITSDSMCKTALPKVVGL